MPGDRGRIRLRDDVPIRISNDHRSWWDVKLQGGEAHDSDRKFVVPRPPQCVIVVETVNNEIVRSAERHQIEALLSVEETCAESSLSILRRSTARHNDLVGCCNFYMPGIN